MGTEINGDLRIRHIKISSEKLSFLVDKTHYSFTWAELSQKLAEATSAERNDYRISPSGYGIHWNVLDEDLSIPALIKKADSK